MVSDGTYFGYEAWSAFQSALRFAVVSDDRERDAFCGTLTPFQSALRFAVVSDDRKEYLNELYSGFNPL